MSDHLAVIGGSTIGRDHFPFPVIPYTYAQDYEFSFDVYDACTVFYQVKDWHVHAEVSYDYSYLDEDSVLQIKSADASFDYDFVQLARSGDSWPFGDSDPFEITRESELVYPRPGGGGFNVDSAGDYDNDPDGLMSVSNLIVTDTSDGLGLVAFQLIPQYAMAGGFGLAWKDDGLYMRMLASVTGDFSTPTVLGTITFFSSVLSLNGFTGTIIGPGENLITSANINIQPLHYWAFASGLDNEITQRNPYQDGDPETLLINTDGNPWVPV